MKYLALFAFVAIITSCAPSKKVVKMDYPDPFVFERIDTVSATKVDLFIRAHEWVAKSYGSAKVVIDMQDKEAGKIIGKARVDMGYVSYLVPEHLDYIFSVDVKDGKYRFTISDIRHSGYVAAASRYSSGSKGVSHGDLNMPYVPRKNVNTGLMTRGDSYYRAKNFAMVHFTELLKEFDKSMHTPSKDF